MQELDFRSGMRGLNEELGRHRGREGKVECTLCGAECENVVHVLWECTAYSSSRASFTEKLQELLGDSYADFDLLSNQIAAVVLPPSTTHPLPWAEQHTHAHT